MSRATMGLIAVLLLAWPATASAAKGPKPRNISPPVITGDALRGQTLAVTPGTWSGAPTSLVYTWQRCDSAGSSCASIAAGMTYVLVSNDVGHRLRVQEQATNSAGSTTATSAPTAVVAEPTPPSATSPPTITGSAVTGETLQATKGVWSGSPAPTSFTYQWQRCSGSPGGPTSCADVPSATADTYLVSDADRDTTGQLDVTLRVAVTATNSVGSATSLSAPTAPVVAAAAPANTTLPAISGTTTAGQTLTATPGTWSGAPAPGFAYQWQRCDAQASCTNVGTGGSSYLLAQSDVGQVMRVIVTASNTSGSATATSEMTGTIAAAPVNDPVIAAAGDIACDPSNSNFNGGLGTSGSCRQLAVSNLLVGTGMAAVLALGDNQYYCGGLSAFQQSYDLSWGRIKSITHPVVGNHEYLTSGGTGCDSTNTGAAGYFDYYGASAGTRGQGWYSFDVGSWHLIALNSNCGDAGGCSSSSAQGTWLRADLAAHANQCTLAFWHIPLFSSGGRASSNSKSFWDALYAAGADVILNGHDHIYERFAPQTPAAAIDTTRGIREFIVGTGGANHTTITTIAANSEVRDPNTYGALALTLHANGYDWKFQPEAGQTFSDSGSATCHS